MAYRRTELAALRHGALRLLILVVSASGLMVAACGKRGDPVPPRDRVSQKATISGFQRGNRIRIDWKMPQNNAGKGSILNIDRIDIYRLAEPVTSSQALSEAEFASRAQTIATLRINDDDFGGKTLSYDDSIEFSSQGVRLRYAVRFANAAGQKAAFSNFLLIEPDRRVANVPVDLRAIVSQESVQLAWTAPSSNIDGSSPASILGYNIYRTSSASVPAKMLNRSPVVNTSFDDEFFEFGKKYLYFVRAVSIGTKAEPVESLESNIVEIVPKDTFAPTPPSAITIAAAPANIAIFFAINPEKDIAGYRIYRSTDPSLEQNKWELISPDPLRTNTFQDRRVESGKTYFYYIVAIDNAGNISAPSIVVSDTAP